MKHQHVINSILAGLILLYVFTYSQAYAQSWEQRHQLNTIQQHNFRFEAPSDDSYFLASPLIEFDSLLNSNHWNNNNILYILLADTLIMPTQDIDLGDKIVLVIAREVISPNDETFILLDGEESSMGSFISLHQTFNGGLQFGAILPNGSDQYHYYQQNTSNSDKLGFEYHFSSGNIQSGLVSNTSEYLALISDTQAEQFHEFMKLAMATFAQNQSLSIEQFNWLERIFHAGQGIQNNNNFSQLYLDIVAAKSFYQSTYMANQINARYVPKLNQELYIDAFDAHASRMQYYQQQFERFTDTANSFDDKISATNAMRELHNDTSYAHKQFLARIQSNIEGLIADIQVSRETIFSQRLSLINAQTQFSIGLTRWKHDQIIGAIINGLNASMSFAKGAASVSAGDPNGASDILSGVTLAQSSSISLAKAMKSLNGMIDNLNAIETQLSNLYNELNADLQVSEITEKLQIIEAISVSTEFDLMLWDAFLSEASINIQTAISKGVAGASNYLAELNKLVIYSKALTQMKNTIAVEQARYLDILLMDKVNQSHAQRLSLLIDDYQKTQQGYDTLVGQIERELEQAKRPLFTTLQHYINAYEYWSLQRSAINLSFDMSYADLLSYRSQIEQDYHQALIAFPRFPQTFSNIKLIIDDEAQIARFKETRSLNFTVPLSQPEFTGLNRVRLNKVRAWVKGENIPSGTKLTLNLQNSGVYEDKYNNNVYRFAGNATKRGFQYYNWAQYPEILIDGDVSNEFQFAYFEPTPFTQWQITLPSNGLNQNIQIQDIESVEIEFFGNAITRF
ncbi:hypothetical protein [Pseudoalteromonas byunsanensis]|uniref:Uncharacterized protein n=1 Tax=Pseudoalteromonas byunsanensis TaxID=327939 RepID=A0A1S1N9G5_9GAMM|nr:hypothetical protein [Pseudoalteromonas byunsanensis]OHU94910.1 hypothetical protein BIW53_12885 [Pseudoalteromonas byunsanensis]